MLSLHALRCVPLQLSDGLNAVPMTEREKCECSMVLSPQQLKHVDIGNFMSLVITKIGD